MILEAKPYFRGCPPLPLSARKSRTFPRRKTAALAITNVFSGVLSGRVYPDKTMPPSMPDSTNTTFTGFVILTMMSSAAFSC
jgi:hypothetical protein